MSVQLLDIKVEAIVKKKMQTQAHLLDWLEPQSDSPLLGAEWESVLSEKKSADS